MVRSPRQQREDSKPLPPENEALVPLHIAIHPELYALIVDAAEQTGVSVSEATGTLLAMGMANRDEMQSVIDKKLDEKFKSENLQKDVAKYVKKEMARFLFSFLAPLLHVGRKKKVSN